MRRRHGRRRMHSPTDDLRDLRAVFGPGKLATAERAVMASLILHRNGKSGRTDPSIATIAADTGMCTRSVMRALQELEGNGLIVREMRNGCRTRYSIHPPTSDTESPVAQSHPCQTVTQPVTQSHGTSDTESPERTKERTKERTDESAKLWPAFVEMMDGASLKLTDGRRKCLQRLYREQLATAPDPMALFTATLRAVKASDHHMSNRAYQMPESLFRNEERRERWTEQGRALLNGRANGRGADPRMLSTAELWEAERRER